MDPAFADSFTALAVTHGFRGSPHIDKQNIGPLPRAGVGGLSRGERRCVRECDALTAAQDTRVLSRWTDLPWIGGAVPGGAERYSPIYYQTMGEPTPITTAVFGADAQLAALDEE